MLVVLKCRMQLSNLIALLLTLFTICAQLCLGFENVQHFSGL